jgi:hypothetical protein
MIYGRFQLLLAIPERAQTLSLVGQLGAMALALVIGRFATRSRAAILLVSLLGTIGAMVANILVDGQGAFMFLIFTPVIYFAAIAGRRDLRSL